MNNKKSIIQTIQIPKIQDDCYLCFAQTPEQIFFSIKRIYYILQVTTNLSRGFHAHHKTDQILFCIQGSIKIVLDDGTQREEIFLDRPEVGVVIKKMVWHEMHEFQKDTILLVLASRPYEPEDYIRDYGDFLNVCKSYEGQKNRV